MLVALLLVALDRFPLLQDRAGVARVTFTENVRMTANEFFGHLPDDVVDVECTGLARDRGVHDDEQKKVAQFFAEIRSVVRARRTSDFVHFFDQRRQERLVRLLPVPRTAAGCPQFCDDFAELVKPGHSERSAAESKKPIALLLVWARDSSTSLGMTFQIRQSERWVPNSEISPEVFLPT